MGEQLKKMTVEYVRVEDLKSSGNIRDFVSTPKRETLKRSMAASGILVPLLGHVEGAKKLVDDGNHRHELARELGMETVPIILADHPPTTAELLTLQFAANSLRFNLKPVERARAIERLMKETGWSAAEVSAKLGERSESMISKLLTLLVHPQEVQGLIDEGRIPISSAYLIATVPDPGERQRLIDEVLAGHLTRDKLVKRIKSDKVLNGGTRTQRPPRPKLARIVFPLGARRSLTVAGADLTLTSLISWLEEFLTRVRQLEPQNLELAEVAKVFSATNS